VPICKSCIKSYYKGEFIIENGNEIYCRWCGEGEGELLLCDACPSSFCTRCIEHNFGKFEIQRISNLNDGWDCYICNSNPLKDLILALKWDLPLIRKKSLKSSSYMQICDDISRGQESFPIPVINEVDGEQIPSDFTYITHPVYSQEIVNNSEVAVLDHCDCIGDCSLNPSKCSCMSKTKGIPYDRYGRLRRGDFSAIFECNELCSCHVRCCRNRVVGKGITLKLELFRCPTKIKGWGVRCKEDIKAGTFVVDYLGEILLEKNTEDREIKKGDEYLYNLDYVHRVFATNTLEELGYNHAPSKRPREADVDISLVKTRKLCRLFGREYVEFLDRRGVLARAKAVPFDLLTESNNNVNKRDHQLKETWIESRNNVRDRFWNEAHRIITERAIIEADECFPAYCIDAK